MLERNRTSNFDEVSNNYEELFHRVQCTDWKLFQCSSLNIPVLHRTSGILSISDQFPYLWGVNGCGNGTRKISTCLYQSWRSWSLHIFFCYHYILSVLGKKLKVQLNRFFQCLLIIAFQLQIVRVPLEKFVEFWVKYEKFKFDYNLRNRFLSSPMFQHILTRKVKKTIKSGWLQ